MSAFEGVKPVHAMVGWDASSGLDRLLSGAGVPERFDLLSIDIDGNDYHVWKAMTAFRPTAVIVEFNPTIPNHVEFVQRREISVKQGNGLRSLTKLAADKGYVPVGVTINNVVFLREEVAREHDIPAPGLDELRPWRDAETWLLQLYDGTVVPRGVTFGPWNGVEMRRRGLQTVPPFMRVYPPDARRWQEVLLRWLRRIRRRQAYKD